MIVDAGKCSGVEFYESFTFAGVHSDILNAICHFPSHTLHAIAKWWVDSYESADPSFIPVSVSLGNFLKLFSFSESSLKWSAWSRGVFSVSSSFSMRSEMLKWDLLQQLMLSYNSMEHFYVVYILLSQLWKRVPFKWSSFHSSFPSLFLDRFLSLTKACRARFTRESFLVALEVRGNCSYVCPVETSMIPGWLGVVQ